MNIFNNASFKVFNGSKTAIIGNNGAGKTTLLNLIFNRNKYIDIVPKGFLGYFYQNFENLDNNKTILENVMKDSIQNITTVRTILARLFFDNDNVFKKVGVLSGGEKIKVSFAKLFVSNANILMLDEPTNYLDVNAIKALENMLCEYEGTVLFVSHDKEFVNKVADKILIIEDRRIKEFVGNLKAYEESNKQKPDIEEIVLKMRLTEVIAKLSMPDCHKELLEEEYKGILKQLNKYRS
jgi:macrolide transport system ATP-binding/permease protein